MNFKQPVITTADGKRKFVCLPAAVLVFIVNAEEQILLFSHPRRRGWWEVVNGALEAEETLLDGALRETREEAGAEVRVRPLGTIHASTFRYDANASHMLSTSYLMTYVDGVIVPGDDMHGSEFRWWSLAELADEQVQVIIPTQKWLLHRAVELYRLWQGQMVELQSELSQTTKNKYDLPATSA